MLTGPGGGAFVYGVGEGTVSTVKGNKTPTFKAVVLAEMLAADAALLVHKSHLTKYVLMEFKHTIAQRKKECTVLLKD